MENITLINANNEPINARIIRYFELNKSNYLIYSLNEIDEQNYLKLYAVKVEHQNGSLLSSNITNDADWSAIKELIKVIIRGNKNGVAEVSDLNYNELESLKINEMRVFKLANQLSELLAANKKVREDEAQINIEPIAVEPIVNPEVNVETEPIVQTHEPAETTEDKQQNVEADYYKNLYLKEKEKNEDLNNKLNEIKKLLGAI